MEIVEQQIELLKKSKTDEDITRHFMLILEMYIQVSREEQQKYTDRIVFWTEQHSTENSMLLYYGRFVQGFTFFLSENYEKAFPLLNELQNIFNEKERPEWVCLCTLLLGSIYRTFGDTDLGLKSLWTAHEALSKLPDYFQNYLLAAKITLGGIYIDRKHYGDAKPLFKEALAIAEPGNKYYWIIYALHGLGKIYLAEKNYPEAKDCLERAMKAAEQFNHPVAISNSISELGNYYFNTEDYAHAEQYHKQALALREQNRFIGGAVTSCIILGETYIKQFKPDEAIRILEKGLNLAEQIKVKPKMFRIHLLLSEIYQRKNELEKSLFHYKQYHELHDQVESEDNERKIKNAQMVFEAEQTRKENIIIKKQKAEIERKNIELQETIDELTRARIGKKAKAITLVIAIVFFVIEDFILHSALDFVNTNNYFISIGVKMTIIFSLSPINKTIEHFLLKRIIREKKKEYVVVT